MARNVSSDDAAADAARADPTAASAGWRARWRRAPLPLRIVGYVLLALFAVWLLLFITKGRFLKGTAERFTSSATERRVTVDGDFQLYFAPFNLKFLAEGLHISNPEWASRDDLFSARRIEMRIATLPLVIGEQRIKWLDLDGGAADLEWSQDGTANSWTMGDSDKSAEPFDLPTIERARATGTTVRYRDPRLQLSTDIAIDTVDASDDRIEQAITFDGKGTMRRERFTLTGQLLSPNSVAAGGENRIALALRSGATRLDITGRLPGATELNGADLDLIARGPNLSGLFDFLGVAIPDTRDYRLRSALRPQDGEWRFTSLRGVIGDSDVAGRMTIAVPDGRLLLTADLASRALHMIDVGPMVGYDPQSLEAQGAAAVVERVNGAPRVLPDAPLRVDALRAFDAKVRYKVRSVVGRNIPISNIDLTLDLDRSRLSLSPLTFDMAGGFLSSDIVINARAQPVTTSYDIRLSPTPMGTLLARWGVSESGTSGTIKARLQMTGEGDTVRKSLGTADGRIAIIIPKGTMWARNAQLSELDVGVFVQKMFEQKLKDPVEINCGLIAFTVRQGIASADPILIDTSKNVITGNGGFSFRDERLDLAIRADGKKFSIFSGQSPVALDGYFAAPGVNPVTPELLTRAGAGAALGVVASPLAALFAFVDIGDAQSAACGPVLEGARAAEQRTSKGKARDDVSDGGSGD